MAVPASSPLTIVFVAPPEPDTPAPRGLIGGGGLWTDLLRAEVAACVAAVGHRLYVVPRSERWAEEAVSVAAVQPALILWGLAPDEDDLSDDQPERLLEGPPGTAELPVLPVALGETTARRGVLILPSESRRLCRSLARAAPAGTTPTAPHRAAVLVHQGDGPDGDARWPGLSWALSLLWGGQGRGVLVDAQGPGGSLSARLRTLAPPDSGRLGWQNTGPVPVPGPAVMARLPGAGGVRWWGWTDPEDPAGPETQPPPETPRPLWAAWQACVRAAQEASAWTVVDAGRDLDLAEETAAAGMPMILCTDRPLPAGRAVHPDVLLQTDGAGEAVRFRAADWAGASLAAWNRSARRRSGQRLAAEIALRLEQGTEAPGAGVLAGRIHP